MNSDHTTAYSDSNIVILNVEIDREWYSFIEVHHIQLYK
jgi:hypothetical protein